MKTKKILSLLLAISLLAASAVVGGTLATTAAASAPVYEEGNYLLNGGFESNETMENGNKYAHTMYVGNGQHNLLSDNWVGTNWQNSSNCTYVTHTTDAHSGSYALRFDVKAAGSTLTVYPSALADTLTAGNYRLTAWVKGTNAASSFVVTNAEGTATTTVIPANEQYTQIASDIITVSESGLGTETVIGKTIMGLKLVIAKDAAAGDSTLYIDDIRLEKVEAEAYPNLIIDNPGFEDDETSGTKVGSGQRNEIVSGWHGQAWTPISYTTSLSTEAHSGKYALRFDATESGGGYNIFLRDTAIDTSSIVAGRYNLSVWVKGTVTGAYLKFDYTDDATTDLTVAIPASDTWQQINLYDIMLTDGYTFKTATSNTKYADGTAMTVNASITIYIPYESGKYIMIDDASFSKKPYIFNGDMEIAGTRTSGNHTARQAQPNQIIQDFTNMDWSNGNTDTATNRNVFELVTGGDNVYSGNQALKLINYSSSIDLYSRYDGVELEKGTYKLSLWVKGNGANARVGYGKTYSGADPVSAGTSERTGKETKVTTTETWQKISVTFALYEGEHVRRAKEQNGTYYYNYLSFGVTGSTAGTYAIFDNFELTRVYSAYEAAAAFTGMPAQPAGTDKIVMPDLSENITINITASSDESVVALDGTVTTPVHRTFVDLTLEATDGTDTVSLGTVGVLIHGASETKIDALENEIRLIPQNSTCESNAMIFNAKHSANLLSEEELSHVGNIVTLGERQSSADDYAPAVNEIKLDENGNLAVVSSFPESAYEGYTLVEYGTVFLPASLIDDAVLLTKDTAKTSYAGLEINPAEADDGTYTVILKDSGLLGNKTTDIAVRSYAVVEDENGVQSVLYSLNSGEATTYGVGVTSVATVEAAAE